MAAISECSTLLSMLLRPFRSRLFSRSRVEFCSRASQERRDKIRADNGSVEPRTILRALYRAAPQGDPCGATRTPAPIMLHVSAWVRARSRVAIPAIYASTDSTIFSIGIHLVLSRSRLTGLFTMEFGTRRLFLCRISFEVLGTDG